MNSSFLLKDKESPYWPNFTEAGAHAEPGHPETVIESDGGFSKILERTKSLLEQIDNEKVKIDFEKACSLIQEGINDHEVQKFFEAHEIVHDYDYWIINSPLELEYAPADWEGVNIYFGKTSLI